MRWDAGWESSLAANINYLFSKRKDISEDRTENSEGWVKTEIDSNQGTLPTWIGEPDMCPDRLQNCHGPIIFLASYYSNFEWLLCLCFELVCWVYLLVYKQSLDEINRAQDLLGWKQPGSLVEELLHTRNLIFVWTRYRSQDPGPWAWYAHWMRLRGLWDGRVYFTYGKNLNTCGPRVDFID